MKQDIIDISSLCHIFSRGFPLRCIDAKVKARVDCAARHAPCRFLSRITFAARKYIVSSLYKTLFPCAFSLYLVNKNRHDGNKEKERDASSPGSGDESILSFRVFLVAALRKKTMKMSQDGQGDLSIDESGRTSARAHTERRRKRRRRKKEKKRNRVGNIRRNICLCSRSRPVRPSASTKAERAAAVAPEVRTARDARNASRVNLFLGRGGVAPSRRNIVVGRVRWRRVRLLRERRTRRRERERENGKETGERSTTGGERRGVSLSPPWKWDGNWMTAWQQPPGRSETLVSVRHDSGSFVYQYFAKEANILDMLYTARCPFFSLSLSLSYTVARGERNF